MKSVLVLVLAAAVSLAQDAPTPGAPKKEEPAKADYPLGPMAREIGAALVRETVEKEDAVLVFVLDDAPGLGLKYGVLPPFYETLNRLALKEEGRLWVAVVALSETPYVVQEPTRSLTDLLAAVEKIAAAPNEKYKNTLEAVRLGAFTARGISGTRAVFLYTQINGDTEDDLEATVAWLKSSKTRFYSATPETAYSDHYWSEAQPRLGVIMDGDRQVKLGFALRGQESAFVEFPYRWFFAAQPDVTASVPSGFTYYSLSRLAAETGGQAWRYSPDGGTAATFCQTIPCPVCNGQHKECGAVYDETKLKLTAPSLAARHEILGGWGSDPFFMTYHRAWGEAADLGVISTSPVLGRNGGLSEDDSPPARGARVPWQTLNGSWELTAKTAARYADGLRKIAVPLEAEYARANANFHKADKRLLATSEAMLAYLEVSRMSVQQWQNYCLERAAKKDLDIGSIQALQIRPRYSFCHGGKALEDLPIYGDAGARAEWKEMCANVDRMISHQTGTPWGILMRHAVVLDWQPVLYPKEQKPQGKQPKQQPGKSDSGKTATGPPPPPSKPAKTGGGGSGSGGTATGK